VMLYTNSLIIIALAAYFFLIPGFIVISNIQTSHPKNKKSK
jgi:uncharacterized membrane protein YraQ (UPF0718 family)